MPQPLSTSTAFPAPLPCVDGQWHNVHRSPGSPPFPAADLHHSSCHWPSSCCSSYSDLALHQQTLKGAMYQEGLLRHLAGCRIVHLLQSCHGRQMCQYHLQRLLGDTCEVATIIFKETCAAGSCSPIRNSSFVLARTDASMAPKERMIHTVFWRSDQWMWEWWQSGASAATISWQSQRADVCMERRSLVPTVVWMKLSKRTGTTPMLLPCGRQKKTRACSLDWIRKDSRWKQRKQRGKTGQLTSCPLWCSHDDGSYQQTVGHSSDLQPWLQGTYLNLICKMHWERNK